jgi:hypothetical protein
VPLEKPVEQHESVAAWSRGLREQWGGDPLAEDPAKIQTLAGFCEFAGMDPDELVAFCFLRKRDTGERFASAVRRKELGAKLREHRTALGLSGTPARKLVSDVLSFLIHNGVMMTPGMV